MGIKFDKDPVAVGKNNYVTKIVNAYIIHEETWSKLHLNNFKLKNCLFCATVTNMIKYSDKEK